MPKNSNLGARTWWGVRWLSVLELLGEEYSGRLSRGRSYARNGSVQAFNVRAGHIQARVRGSYWEDYAVHIETPPLANAVWNAVFTAVSGEAAYTARLLAGELPEDFPEIVRRAGGTLFPPFEDLASSCSCLDWETPCKHVLALHFVFAARLDADPGLLLTFRGRTAQQLAAALHSRWVADGPVTQIEMPPSPEGAASLRPEGFFTAGAMLERFEVAYTPPEADGGLLQRLGTPPFAAPGEDPITPLLGAYARVTEAALKAVARSRRSAKPGRKV